MFSGDSYLLLGFPDGSVVKNVHLPMKVVPMSTCQWRHGFHPWVRKIPWRRKWQPTPGFLPEKSHGWRRLVGHSP